jgi:repressor LexA
MLALTPRQHKAVSFIRSYYIEKGYSPSVLEIAAALGLSSKSGAQRLVSALQDRGAITRKPGQARGISLTQYARPPGSAEEALSVAREQLLWALNNGRTVAEALYEILGRPVAEPNLDLAILEIAKWWEAMREGV